MKRVTLFLLVYFISSLFLLSQKATTDIYGKIFLEDGSYMPGVMVTLSGDKIGSITTISSEFGNFRLLKLPPAVYKLKFELMGFKTIVRKNIRLYVGKNLTLNIEMETTELREEVLVTEKPPLIDTRKTNVGVNITKEMIETLPTARNPWTILNLVPGIMMDREDVGGNESGQQSKFYGHGSDGDDSSWNIDEANIYTGMAPGYLDVNGYEEIQISVGSNDIAYQTGGVQLNFVTKRGGNNLSGNLHLYVEDKAWEMEQDLPEYYEDQGFVFPGINRLYQYGITFGGPVIKDKWWFIGSWSTQDIHARTEVGDEDQTLLLSSYLKTNFQLGNTSGEFHLTYINKKKWGRQVLTRAQQDEGTLVDQEGPGYWYYGKIEQVFGDLMVTAKALYGYNWWGTYPRNSDIDDQGHNTGDDWYWYHVPRYYSGSLMFYKNEGDILNLSVDGNYFAENILGGDHEIRFGVDYYNMNNTSQTLYPNQRIAWSYLKDYPTVYQEIWLMPDTLADHTFNRLSSYFADTATFGRLSLNLGVRYDQERGRLNEYTQRAFSWHEPGSPNHGEVLFPEYLSELKVNAGESPLKYTVFSPRLSLTYDIGGKGKNVIKISAARYGSYGGDDLALKNQSYRELDVLWFDDGDMIPEYEELFLGDQSLDYSTWENVSLIDYETGWKRISVDENFNSPLLDELSVSIETSLAENMTASVTGFYKRRHNLTREIGVLEDGRLETDAGNWYYGGEFEFETGEKVPYFLRNEKPETIYYTNYDKNTYEQYMALQFLLSKKFSNKWMLDISLTLADSKKYYKKEDFDGYSWGVGAGDQTNYDFLNGAAPVNLASRTSGTVIVNSRWMVKVSGLVQLPFGINATGVLSAREGYIIPYHEIYNRPGLGLEMMFKPDTKLGDNRLDSFWTLNLGLEKSFKINDTAVLTLFVNGYNITNNSTTLSVETDLVADNLNQPLRVLNPGIFQFGVRVNF